MSTIKLRDYQKEVVEKLKTDKIGIVSAATGSGKTVMMAESIKNEYNNNPKGKTLILVHLNDLLIQTKENIEKLTGLTVGMYNGTVKDDPNKHEVMVSTWQSMKMAIEDGVFTSDYFYSIKVDECHNVKNGGYQKVVKFFDPQILHGFTATPYGYGQDIILDTFNKNIIYEIGLLDLIEKGYLSNMKVVMAVSDQSNKNEEVVKKYNIEKFDKINEECDSFSKKGWTPKAIHFFSMNKKFDRISEWDLLHGNSYHEISSRKSVKDRKLALKRFSNEDSHISHLLSNRCLNEGIDLPIANILVFHETVGNFRVLSQRMGRGLRKWEENKDIITTIMLFGENSNHFELERMTDFIEEINHEKNRFNLEKKKITSDIPITVQYIENTEDFLKKYKEGVEKRRLSSLKHEVKCECCGESFEVSNHRFNKANIFRCVKCIENNKNRVPNIKCAICGKPFYLTPAYLKYAQEGKIKRNCPVCKEKSKIKTPNTKCPTCGKLFYLNPSRVKLAQKRNMKKKCPECVEKIQNRDPNLECSTCGKLFYIAPSNLKRVKDRKLKRNCPDCRAKKIKYLQNIKCVTCGKQFPYRLSQLEVSNNVHLKRNCPECLAKNKNKIPNVECSTCGKAIYVSPSWEKVVKAEKSNIYCPVCMPTNKKKEMNIECSTCGKSFHAAPSLAKYVKEQKLTRNCPDCKAKKRKSEKLQLLCG